MVQAVVAICGMKPYFTSILIQRVALSLTICDLILHPFLDTNFIKRPYGPQNPRVRSVSHEHAMSNGVRDAARPHVAGRLLPSAPQRSPSPVQRQQGRFTWLSDSTGLSGCLAVCLRAAFWNVLGFDVLKEIGFGPLPGSGNALPVSVPPSAYGRLLVELTLIHVNSM